MAGSAVETVVSACCLVVRVRGEMDCETAPVLRPRFRELIARGKRCVVLDLSGVSFCDSVGLGLLVGVWRQAEAGEAVLVLACVPEQVRRIIATTGLDQVLRCYATVTEAEAAVGG
ncbi:STAS domain-containing protein [Streptomyces sp. BH055]|uniref:STAS domain-containing protein n=1 Tax=unclassified Streptomyces TaxID=2593676 RepID=UPI003BB64E5F